MIRTAPGIWSNDGFRILRDLPIKIKIYRGKSKKAQYRKGRWVLVAKYPDFAYYGEMRVYSHTHEEALNQARKIISVRIKGLNK